VGDLDPIALLGVAIAIVIASFMSGVFGMAGGLFLMAALLAVGLSVPVAMTVHGIAQGSSNVWRAALWFQFIDFRIALWHGLGIVIALAVLAQLAFVPDRALVLIALGAVPYLAMGLPSRYVPQADTPLGGTLSGISSFGIALIGGVSGPIFDSFFARSQADRRTIVASKAVCQFLGNATKAAYFASLAGSGALPSLPVLAAIVALGLAGTLLSRRVLEAMSDAAFRRWTRTILLTIGTGCIIAGVLDLVGRAH
jgi:uncharacterized membrane protein YfcA